jgi:CDP-diacylglycerol--serine O-phosphatidyltransferase
MLGLIVISSYLLVSEVPMFSMKFKNFSWRCNKTRYVFLVVALPMLLLGYLAPVVIITWYLLLSIALYVKGTRP